MSGWWGKTWTVVRREFLVNITTKSFLFGLMLTPILFVAVMFLPGVFKGGKKSKKIERRVAVHDATAAP